MDPRLIDVLHRGRERAISAWDLGGLLVDPGPESCLVSLLAGVSQPPRALLLTHIHLDHAGAAGALVRRFPQLRVYVHEVGAPHLVDPSKLIASAGRLYGDEMQELWGEVLPVPESNIQPLRGGENLRIEGRDINVTYTPGHASHHVVYMDASEGTAYVGDVAGVRIPPSEFVMAPTPPPDIDVERWQASIERVRAMRPRRLALTHFGPVDQVSPHLDRVSEALIRQADVARGMIEEGLEAAEAEARFAAELEQRIRCSSDEQTAAAAMQASPPNQLWLGLKRYWEKRGTAEVATTEA